MQLRNVIAVIDWFTFSALLYLYAVPLWCLFEERWDLLQVTSLTWVMYALLHKLEEAEVCFEHLCEFLELFRVLKEVMLINFVPLLELQVKLIFEIVLLRYPLLPIQHKFFLLFYAFIIALRILFNQRFQSAVFRENCALNCIKWLGVDDLQFCWADFLLVGACRMCFASRWAEDFLKFVYLF